MGVNEAVLAPRRCRSVVAALAVVAAHVSQAAPASAYELEEHLQTAQRAYLAVCNELTGKAQQPPPALDEQQHRRLVEIACEHAESRAIHYGQYVALSGDHLSEEAFGNLKGDLDAESLVTYLNLAIHDADHFFPGNVRQYEEKHDRALDLAIAAAELSKDPEAWLQVRKQFWVAFYAAAYGDHFLQDSFAGGHGSFNRAASTPAASRAFHNTLNEEGVILRDGAGRTWVAFGDGHLNLHTQGEAQPCVPLDAKDVGRLVKRAAPEEESDIGHNRGALLVQEATSASVRDFILAFVTGVRSAPRERAVVLRLPAECLGTRSEGCTPNTTVTKLRQQTPSTAFARLSLCTPVETYEAPLSVLQRELEQCWAAPLPAASAATQAAAVPAAAILPPATQPRQCSAQTAAFEQGLGDLRGHYQDELAQLDKRGEWAPLLGAMDPARLRFDLAPEAVYLARLAPTDHLLAAALSLRSYDLLLWGPSFGYYSHVADGIPSDRGLMGGFTFGLPLGLKYGSLLSWEAVFRPTLYLPLSGDRQTTYLSLPVGLQLGVQVLWMTLALSVAYAGNYAFEAEPRARDLGWAHGIETAFALRFAFGLEGGGYKSAPPF